MFSINYLLCSNFINFITSKDNKYNKNIYIYIYQMHEGLLFVCSKMADETNLSSKLPVADRTREV